MYNPKDPSFELGYVRNRLENTFVVVPTLKEVVKVVAVSQRGTSAYLDIERKGHGPANERISIEDARLESPRLGYVDCDDLSFFTTRIPVRNDWKQGIRFENTVCVHKGETSRLRFPIFSLKQPVFSMYSKIGEALEKIEDYFKEVALSRSFSLSEGGELRYKGGGSVGKVNCYNGKVYLDGSKMWLKEVFEEEVGVVENS